MVQGRLNWFGLVCRNYVRQQPSGRTYKWKGRQRWRHAIYDIGIVLARSQWDSMQSVLFAVKHYVRRGIRMWLSNRLHHLLCEGGHCYSVSEESKLCGYVKIKLICVFELIVCNIYI